MLDTIVNKINAVVWSPALVVLLIFAGLYFSLRTRFVQVRRIGLMFKLLLSSHKGGTKTEKMSSFRALCLAISGCIGTGNIVGVATAIAFGGPGAIFWMWVIAFFGAATAFVESTMAQIYRFKRKDGWRGGPAAYIEKGLGLKWLGIVFSVFVILGYGLFIVSVQANGFSNAFSNSFSVNPLYSGILLATLVLAVTLGGMKRIGSFVSKVTPVAAIAYILLAIVILVLNYDKVPGVFASIFKGAFGFDQALGGILGSTIAMGVRRGLFSNEAGAGGAAIASATADVDKPAKQGLMQALAVYIDTLIVCTCTALIILCSGLYNVYDSAGAAIQMNAPELGQNYVGYTQAAIDQTFPGFGGPFVAIVLSVFVLTTIIAYSTYAENSITYICKAIGKEGVFEKVLRYLYFAVLFAMIVFGATNVAGTVWTIGDIGLGLTTWINVIALIILCPKALEALKDLENK